MIFSLICFHIFISFLLQDCLAPRSSMFKPDDDPDLHTWRRLSVFTTAQADPCRLRPWFFMDPQQRKNAQGDCEAAYNSFVSLPEDEQEFCENAALPGCRPLSDCSSIFSCTFRCDIKYTIWRRRLTDGIYERVIRVEEKDRTLQRIALDIMQDRQKSGLNSGL